MGKKASRHRIYDVPLDAGVHIATSEYSSMVGQSAPGSRVLLRCPHCRGATFSADRASITCAGCRTRWPLLDGRIPYLIDAASEHNELLRQEIECQKRALDIYEDPRTLLYHWDRSSIVALAALLPVRGQRVLDLGCGPGRLGVEFARDIVGVDITPALLRRAAERLAFVVGAEARALPFDDASFPMGFARGVLHHLGDPDAALRELYRVLEPGGHLVLFDPRAWAGLEPIKRRLRRRSPLHSKLHRAFTRAEYRTMIEAPGFEILRFEDWDPAGLLIASAIDLLHLGRWGTVRLHHACERLDAAVGWVLRRFAAHPQYGLTMAVLARKPLPDPQPDSEPADPHPSRSEQRP